MANAGGFTIEVQYNARSANAAKQAAEALAQDLGALAWNNYGVNVELVRLTGHSHSDIIGNSNGNQDTDAAPAGRVVTKTPRKSTGRPGRKPDPNGPTVLKARLEELGWDGPTAMPTPRLRQLVKDVERLGVDKAKAKLPKRGRKPGSTVTKKATVAATKAVARKAGPRKSVGSRAVKSAKRAKRIVRH